MLIGGRIRGWLLTSFAICCGAPQAGLSGHISGHVRDENGAPVSGVHISVHPADSSQSGALQTETDPDGAFSLTLSPGEFLLDAEHQGYYRLKDQPVHVDAGVAPDFTQDVSLTLNTVREVFQAVDVSGQPSPTDIEQTQNEERLTGTQINDILYPNSHSLVNAMKLMPGVVQDSGGGVHFNGSTGNQVQYLLNGFNITNPISGQLNTTLAVEGIRSLDYSSGRESPELGKGTAGVLAINTDSGTDNFHYTATDFVPGVDVRQGVRLGNSFPRFGVSGPIIKKKAWFSDTLDFEYTNTLITSLPAGQNTSVGWSANNLLHFQADLTPRNILYADFLANVGNQDHAGLGVLDPVSTTQTLRTREYFGSIKDQIYLGNRSMLEFGYAHNDFITTQTPQGDAFYVYSAEGRSGNYFIQATQKGTRDQALVHGYAPQFHWLGSHQIQAGLDADALRYNGTFSRTGYEVLGLSNQLLSETTFTGPGIFRVHDTEAAPWMLDTWRIAARLQVDAGFRWDWDQRVANGSAANGAWSPRASFSWAPWASGRTRISGGYAVTHDAVALAPFGMVLDQTALTTSYNAAGTPLGPPAVTTFTLPSGPLQLPAATNWSLNLDREITARLFASVKLLRRRGTDGFDFVNTLAPNAPPSVLPLPDGAAGGVYQLANLRRDDYSSVQIAVRQNFSGQYGWMVSYTRSSAVSTALVDSNAAEPLAILPGLVPLPWDAPNRLLGWAYLPLPIQKRKKVWAISALVDARSGFPFSIQQANGVISGAVDSQRYPFNFDLDLAIERIITLHNYRFALRLGGDNLTNSKNPTAVENVIGAPTFMQFLGDEGRHYVIRIRFFGHAVGK